MRGMFSKLILAVLLVLLVIGLFGRQLIVSRQETEEPVPAETTPSPEPPESEPAETVSAPEESPEAAESIPAEPEQTPEATEQVIVQPQAESIYAYQ